MKKYILMSIVSLITSLAIAQNQSKTVSYTDGINKFKGIFTEPEKLQKNRVGILILPAWMGITEHTKNVAQKLSNSGYYTFIADVYGEGNIPQNTKEAAERSGALKSDIDTYRKRIRLALDQLIKSGADKDKIVIIGYCFGGQGALEAARANFPVKGVVSFHGGLSRDIKKEIDTIQPKVLVLHGADDPFIPETDIKNFQDEMRKAKADWQMVYYSNAVHSFTEPTAGNDNSKGAAYNLNADQRSWQVARDFIFEVIFGFNP